MQQQVGDGKVVVEDWFTIAVERGLAGRDVDLDGDQALSVFGDRLHLNHAIDGDGFMRAR